MAVQEGVEVRVEVIATVCAGVLVVDWASSEQNIEPFVPRTLLADLICEMGRIQVSMLQRMIDSWREHTPDVLQLASQHVLLVRHNEAISGVPQLSTMLMEHFFQATQGEDMFDDE